jgi:virulence-associated protein VagC
MYIHQWLQLVKLAKVFNSGHSQAVRLLIKLRFHFKEVEIYRHEKDSVTFDNEKIWSTAS